MSKLVKDSFLYTVAELVNKGIPFLLLPILTQYLSPDDYGRIAVFNSAMAVFSVFIGLSLNSFISVQFFRVTKGLIKNYVGAVLTISGLAFISCLIIVWLLENQLKSYVDLSLYWILIAAIVSLGSVITLINLALLLVEQKPKYFASFQLVETTIKLLLSLLFVIVLGWSWEGRLYGILFGVVVTAISSIVYLKRRDYIDLNFNKGQIKEAIDYGVPLIPHQLSIWLRNGAIVMIVASFSGSYETGLYNVGNYFALILIVLGTAFNQAWSPYLFKKLSGDIDESLKKKIVRYSYLGFIVLIVLALLITWISPFLIETFLDPSYIGSSKFIGYLTLGAAFQGMYLLVVNYIFYMKKTKKLALITFVVSIINIGLAFYFINVYGAIGAAKANMITFFISFISVWYYSNKVYKMPWFKFY